MGLTRVDIILCPRCYSSDLGLNNREEIGDKKFKLEFLCLDCEEVFRREVDKI